MLSSAERTGLAGDSSKGYSTKVESIIDTTAFPSGTTKVSHLVSRAGSPAT